MTRKRLPETQIQEVIRRLRGELTYDAFAEKAGKRGQGSQFSKYEKGTKRPDAETLAAIAVAAGVSDAVFYEPEERPSIQAEELARIRDRLQSLVAEIDSALDPSSAAKALRVSEEVEKSLKRVRRRKQAPGENETEKENPDESGKRETQ
jgi:transcriptional regulator with XRE-family HTH domain